MIDFVFLQALLIFKGVMIEWVVMRGFSTLG
jgi:hypothetical protein